MSAPTKSFLFPVKHWLVSLLIGGLLAAATDPQQYASKGLPGYLLIAGVYVVFSLGFSIPVFIIYASIFSISARRVSSRLLLKALACATAITGIWLTYWLTERTIEAEICAAYSISVVLTALALKVE